MTAQTQPPTAAAWPGYAQRNTRALSSAAVAAAFLTGCLSTETPDAVPTEPEAPPATIRISTSTSGDDRDQDGYKAEVHWGELLTSVEMPSNGTASIVVTPTNCAPTDGLCGYRVSLTGLAPNCAVEPTADWWSTTRQVPVDRGQTKEVSFTVRCEPVASARLPAGSPLAFVREGRIHVVDSDGSNAVALTEGHDDASPAWSPDGQRIAFTRGRWPARDIYVMNADGSNLARRTNGGYNEDPAFSPDGRLIAFASVGSNGMDIHTMGAEVEGGPATAVVSRTGWEAQPSWTPTGDIGFVSDWFAYDFTSDVFVTTPAGAPITALTNGFGRDGIEQFYQPAWSPDGRLIAAVACRQAYATCDAATITLLKSDGTVHGRLAATRELAHPTWSPDGRTISYSRAGLILWVRADGSERGLIAVNGHSPAWRPQPRTGSGN